MKKQITKLKLTFLDFERWLDSEGHHWSHFDQMFQSFSPNEENSKSKNKWQKNSISLGFDYFHSIFTSIKWVVILFTPIDSFADNDRNEQHLTKLGIILIYDQSIGLMRAGGWLKINALDTYWLETIHKSNSLKLEKTLMKRCCLQGNAVQI